MKNVLFSALGPQNARLLTCKNVLIVCTITLGLMILLTQKRMHDYMDHKDLTNSGVGNPIPRDELRDNDYNEDVGEDEDGKKDEKIAENNRETEVAESGSSRNMTNPRYDKLDHETVQYIPIETVKQLGGRQVANKYKINNTGNVYGQ